MPSDDDTETENEIVVTADRISSDDNGGGGFWGGFGGTFGVVQGQQGPVGGGGGGATPPSPEEENEIIVTAPRPSDADGDDTPPTVGDFVDAAFNFLDGRVDGEDGFEFKSTPPNIEYDLSVEPGGDSATFSVYDRMNETKTTYYYTNDGSYGTFDAPLDNSDFSRGGQYSNPAPSIDYDFF
ncbi:hypothetical protein [uncultured Tateyamaria sp.]|uniref:hypothetical protein n=1 Tax=uncultured Tateyamaria sp. TaxID=455651 RepID=UPI00262AF8DB|nr:hypothetical protein [uncultured Tateyamaria sp.]